MQDEFFFRHNSGAELDWMNCSRAQIEEFGGWDRLWEEGEPFDEAKPYPNEHACRIRPPEQFKRGSFRRTRRRADRRTLWLIVGRLKSDPSHTTLQAFRYPKDEWPVVDARRHCKRHEGILFEPARESSGKRDFELEDGRRIDPLWLGAKLLEVGEFSVPAQIKGVDEDSRIVEGYANTKDLDRVGDVVDPKAFRRSLNYFRKHGKLLLFHNTTMPAGRVLDAKIDEHGLWIKGQIVRGSHPLHYAEEAWNLMRQGVLDAFSIGFRVIGLEAVNLEEEPELAQAAHAQGHSEVRRITELDLYEVSIVSVPANPHAHFSVLGAMVDAAEGRSWEGPRIDGFSIVMGRPAQLVLDAEERSTYKHNLDDYIESMKVEVLEIERFVAENEIGVDLKNERREIETFLKGFENKGR